MLRADGIPLHDLDYNTLSEEAFSFTHATFSVEAVHIALLHCVSEGIIAHMDEKHPVRDHLVYLRG